MIYNLKNEIEITAASEYFTKLIERGSKIELKEKRKRTLRQNSYLHLILTWFGIETGYTLPEAKQMFKELTPDVFKYEKNGREFWKSSSDVDTKQMTIAIDRFRNYSSAQAGVYLPAPDEKAFLEHIEKESSKYGNKVFS